ncbi:MAG TPA: hypothetical protein VGV92_02830 [Gammaproteobacteria bacterium]|nr:hypothetical protein [Gammaproteobacteria bacterium]
MQDVTEQSIVPRGLARMLRIVRSTAPMLIGLSLVAAFESESLIPLTLVFTLGSLYPPGSSAVIATETDENKTNPGRKALQAADNFVHANWMIFRLDSGLTVLGTYIVRGKIGAVIYPSWTVVPLQVPAIFLGEEYARTRYIESNSKWSRALGVILLSAQLFRFLDVWLEVAATAGVVVSDLVRPVFVVGAVGAGIPLKLLENRSSKIYTLNEIIKYASWSTYFISGVLANLNLKSLVSPIPTYLFQSLALASMGLACVKISYDQRNSTKEEKIPDVEAQKEEAQSEELSEPEKPTAEEETKSEPVFPKKTEVGCWSRLREKVSRFWSAPSENNSSITSEQTNLLAETYPNSKSPSLNSSTLGH